MTEVYFLALKKVNSCTVNYCKEDKEADMKDKEQEVIIWALHILWLHSSLLLPVLEVDPEED